jgi:hypothetical protein
VLSVWTGSRGSLTEIVANDDTGSLQSQVNLLVEPGVTYYIMAGGYYSIGGVRHLNASEIMFCDAVSEIPDAECQVLLTLYDGTDGANWTDNIGWYQTFTPCSWYGVTCEAGHLGRLELARNGLSGTIPPELANLTEFNTLNLGDNQLTGAIPAWLGSLSQFENIQLSYNLLDGNLPTWLGTMTGLEYLGLAGNRFDGPIPSQFGNLVDLEMLDLSSNAFAGDVPASFANLTGLYNLDMGYNALPASDPAVIGFLNTKDSDWSTTQTVPPPNVQASPVSMSSLSITWTPIAYTTDGGYYQALYSPTPGGSYTAGCATADKTGTDPAFPLPGADVGKRNRYKLPSPLGQGMYYWRVRAVDRAGNVSLWSDTRVFHVVAGNTSLEILTPAPSPVPTGMPMSQPPPPHKVDSEPATPEPPVMRTPPPGHPPGSPDDPERPPAAR